MGTAVDPGLIKRTQEELGKYVKKPPLTDKLLNKPPFRFLHDVVNAIVTETGFLAGLFTEDELSSQNIKDKEAKVAFLQKCIDATSLATGETYSVRPSKIVAGHDVDKTNEWLQGLGRAISQNVDSTEAVQQILSGAKPDKPKKSDKEKSEKKERSKKEVTANNGSIKPKDPKPKKVPNPKDSNPNANKSPKSTSNDSLKPSKTLNTSKDRRASKDRSDPVGRTSSKPSGDKGSPVKSSVRKERSKEEKDGKKSSRSRREGKEEKDEKSRRKSKHDSSPEKAKSSKSRSASRIGQAKEKENSPPHEKIEEDGMIPNGHATLDEIESVQTPKSARPPSARPADSQEPAEGIDELIDEGIETQETPSDDSQIPHESMPLVGDNNGEGVRTAAAAMEGGLDLGGPESLLQVEPEQEMNEGETPVISSLVGENNNNIDPAILKAMAPGNEVSQPNDGENHLEAPSAPEPPDSGVGSLESPKQTPLQAPLQESRNTPAPSAPKTGPQPLRALESFGDDSDVPSAPFPQQPPEQEEQPAYPTREKSARPRTGRRSARPPSARPAPPRIRERREIPKEEIPRPATSKPVASIISSSIGDDDDDNFMVEESKPVVEDDLISVDPLAGSTAVATAAAAVEDGEGAGLLVAQILETKKELEDGRRNAFSPETPGHRRVQIEQSQLSDANRRKERELIQKDVQKLSGSIQSITRSVNPLAKMLDYLQEDLDSMQKELEMWRDENKKLGHTLKSEQSMTEQALEPLRSQLVELESAVQEQRDKLSAVKSNILRNNDKISRLMAGINLNM